MGFILWIIVFITFLAILGLGWDTFFTGVIKGADKLGITPAIKNISDNAKASINEIISNTSKGVIDKTLE